MTATERHPFDRLTGRAILLGSLFGGLVPTAAVLLLVRADWTRAAAIAMITGYFGVAVTLLVLARVYGVSLARLFGRRPSVREVFLAIGLGLLLLVFSFGLIAVIVGAASFVIPSFLDTWRKGPSMEVAVYDGGRLDVLTSGLLAFMAAVVAPFVEELVFRGFLLTRWARRFGVRAGVVGTALLFGLLHFAFQPIAACAFGLVGAVLYFRTRSLFVPMIAHAASNATIVGFVFLAGESSGVPIEPASPADLRTIVLGGTGLVALSAPLIALALKTWWPAADTPVPYDDGEPAPTASPPHEVALAAGDVGP